MIPNSVVVRAFAFRSAKLWFGARALLALALANANLPPFPRSTGAVIIVVLITTALCFAELWRRRERVLIGNLGVSQWAIAGLSVVPPTIAELGFIAGVALST